MDSTAEQRHETAMIRDYARILWQRKWVALIPIILVPLAALYFSFKQERIYQASAAVTTTSQNSTISSVYQIAIPYEDPDRFLQTQINVARSPRVAAIAIHRTGSTMTPGEFLADSSVTKSTDSDILTFFFKNHHPDVAARMASAYARAYTTYRRASDSLVLQKALTQVNQQLRRLGHVRRTSPLFDTYTAAVANQQRLQALKNLQGSNTQVVRLATGAGQIQPRPKRNAALGLGLGIFLGIGLAFLWHALDTRVRTGEQVAEGLDLPLLARIPAPPRRLKRAGAVSMLADPASVQAEAFRVLRTNLEFANLNHAARTILITSAIEQEGKSTTAINTAVAFARAGKHVALVDLDLRRPVIDRTFGLEGRAGITDVALGHADLDEAIATIALTDGAAGLADGNGRQALLDGVLEVVPSGPIPPNPGEFMSSVRLGEILRELRDRSDLVLLDTAPVLRVGDAMALSTQVEGIVVLARLNVLRRPMLRDLHRVLDATPVPKLGFVITGAEGEAGYEYRRYYRRGSKRSERQRVV